MLISHSITVRKIPADEIWLSKKSYFDSQTDKEELLAAQNLMLDAIFKPEPRAVQ